MADTRGQKATHQMGQTGNGMSSEMQACIRECLNCYSTCQTTLAYCLQQGGRHVEARHVRLLQDCTEICQTSADFMLRGSDLYGRVCGVCAEVCDRCAQDCEQFGDDQQMKACAQACRSCAVSCRQMASIPI
jgi:hypothetical protein